MDSVHYFVRGLFRGMSVNAKIDEQREELETHLNERIADSMNSGMKETEAFTQVIASLGNLDELIETMTGEKKKVYASKLELMIRALGLLYGTIYMLAIGIWFYHTGFGSYAVYIAIPGWLGFFLPSCFSYFEYRKNPLRTALVPVDTSLQFRTAVLGWASISAASWIANILLFSSGTFLSVIWAWMPTLGVLTWPLDTLCSSLLIRHWAPVIPANE